MGKIVWALYATGKGEEHLLAVGPRAKCEAERRYWADRLNISEGHDVFLIQGFKG